MTTEGLRVAVTGASGYVGSRIVRYLRSHNVAVVELSRKESADTRRFDLGKAVTPDALADVDVLVHCAYDFGPRQWDDIERINVEGSLRLFAAARSAGVRRIIFISTISAFPECRSLYGRAKLMVEDEGRADGAIVIRPGLVYDDGSPGGMVGAIGRLVGSAPLVPLVGGGKQLFYLCHSDDLARLIHALSAADAAVDGPITAASREGLYFRDILRTLARMKGKRPLFVSVPATLPLLALRLLERIGINSRLRSDSLISLLNQNPSVDFAPLDRLGLAFRTYGPQGHREHRDDHRETFDHGPA